MVTGVRRPYLRASFKPRPVRESTPARHALPSTRAVSGIQIVGRPQLNGHSPHTTRCRNTGMGCTCDLSIDCSPQCATALVCRILHAHVRRCVCWRLFRLLLSLPCITIRAGILLPGPCRLSRAGVVRRWHSAVGRFYHARSNSVRRGKCANLRMRHGLAPLAGQCLSANSQRVVVVLHGFNASLFGTLRRRSSNARSLNSTLVSRGRAGRIDCSPRNRPV